MSKVDARPVRQTQDLETRTAVGRPRGTGAQLVYQKLRDRILSLEMPARTDVNELELVNEFGVSRTPVREALIRLSSDGLLDLLPNKGARVAPLDADDVPEILEALEIAQRITARWAAERRTEKDLRAIAAGGEAFRRAVETADYTAMTDANREFHFNIGRACGNKHVSEWFGSLLNSSMRLARLAYAQAPLDEAAFKAFHRTVVSEHDAMEEAILVRDAERSDRLAREHVALFRNRVMGYLARNGAASILV